MPDHEPELAQINTSLRLLLHSFLSPTDGEQDNNIHSSPHIPPPSPLPFDWGLFATLTDTELPLSITDQCLSDLSRALLDGLDSVSLSSEEELNECSDNDEDLMHHDAEFNMPSGMPIPSSLNILIFTSFSGL